MKKYDDEFLEEMWCEFREMPISKEDYDKAMDMAWDIVNKE